MKMKVKKICMLTSTHRALDSRIFYKEAKTLLNEGNSIVIIAYYPNREIIDEIKIIPLSLPKSMFERMTKVVWEVFKLAVKEDADIYHFHDAELIFIGLLLKLYGKKVIYDVHEDFPGVVMCKNWIPFWIRPIVSKLTKLTEKIAAIGFDGIITATFGIAKSFPKKKTITIQNFPIISEFQFQEVKPYKLRDPLIIYIGAINITRGLREMVKAISLIPSNLKARLIIAGAFSSKIIEDEVCKIKKCKRVKYIGWQSRERITILLRNVKVGLVIFYPMPNQIESQPIKLYEYMAAGIPIIVSNFPLWRKIIEDIGCGILVDPLKPTDIANAISWLLGHPDQAEAMGKRGQEAVKVKYNWGIEAKKLIKFYENLLQ